MGCGLPRQLRPWGSNRKNDVAPVVIPDELRTSDIEVYGAMLDLLPNRELVCGFLVSIKIEMVAFFR